MKKVGFPVSHKENERRRAIVPEDLAKVKHPETVYIQKGYGDVLGFCDAEYTKYGCGALDRYEILKLDVIIDPKAGDADYFDSLKAGQVLFGWIHAVQNRDITDALINSKVKAIAWEDMFEDGRHTFWRNNVIAGEAAILHAFRYYGKMPYETTAAVLGNGNVARGAISALMRLGAKVNVYDIFQEKLFQKEMYKYDVLVNAILWDIYRDDHIIYKKDLKKLKKGAIIIDISCDREKGVESSVPTTIDEPVYYVDGIMHYAVDHTPALFYKTASGAISAEALRFIDILAEGKEEQNETLKNSIIIADGKIVDGKIKKFQGR